MPPLPESPAPASTTAAAPMPMRQPWPSWKQVVVILGGGFLLALSSCFGMIFSFDMRGNEDASTIVLAVTSIAFVGGLLAFLVGGVMFFMKILRILFGKSGASS